MGLFKNKNEALTSDLEHIEGLPNIGEKTMIRVTFDEVSKSLIFEPVLHNKKHGEKPKITLPLHKINNAGMITETEIIEKSKSVGGRAIAGGLLLGPLGAIVGGMSGISNKKKKETKAYYVINYDEDRVITFIIPTFNFSYNKITNEIHKHVDRPAITEL